MVNMLLTTLLASLSFVAASPLPFAQQRNHTLEPRNPEQRDALTGVTTLHSKLPLGTNFCLDEDVPGGFVQLWECHAGVNQQWRLEKVSLDMDNFKAQSVTRFRVRRVDTDRCLHFVAPGESPALALLLLSTCHFRPAGFSLHLRSTLHSGPPLGPPLGPAALTSKPQLTPGSGDHYDIASEYVLPLTLAPCDTAARFTWQDESLCAFIGNGVDYYVKNGRDYGFCVSPANALESGMTNGDRLAVKSDPGYRMKFDTTLAHADASELAEYGLPVRTGGRQVWHP